MPGLGLPDAAWRPHPADYAPGIESLDLGIPGLTNIVRIGAGGNAVVYRARQDELDRDIVIKVLTSGDSDATRRRFDRERRAMGRLSQAKGIAPIYGSGFTPQGYPYLLMPFYERGSLQDWIEAGGPLDPSEVLRVGVAVCRAVHSAHESGVLHRDIKPANILMTGSGEPAVGDFGIAQLLDDRLGTSQAITLTPLYTAPEVFDGVESGVASDVYSIGATLFALLAGRAAYSDPDGSASMLALIRRVNEGPVPPLPDTTPTGLAAVITRAMSKEPAARQPSAAVLADELERASLARAVGRSERPSRQVLAAIAALVALVPLAVVAAVVLSRSDSSTIVADPAPLSPTVAGEVQPTPQASETATSAPTPSRQAAPVDLAVALAAAETAIVRIEAFSCSGAEVATGVLLNDGLVVTEGRILSSPWHIDVTIGGETRHAAAQTSDAERGLAFVALEDASGLDVLRGSVVESGDRIVVVDGDGRAASATIGTDEQGRFVLVGLDRPDRVGSGDAVLTEAGGLVGVVTMRPDAIGVETPASLEQRWARIPPNHRCGPGLRDLTPGDAAAAVSPAIRELLTMQALSDAFADERWDLVRELEPGKASLTDESFAEGWRPLRRGFVYPVARSIETDGTARWRIGLVGHETRDGNDLTTLFCLTWTVDPKSLTVAQTNEDSVTVYGPRPDQPQRQGFVDPADLRVLIDQNCPLR